MSSTTHSNSTEETVSASREDMVAYMTEANELNKWTRPSIRSRNIPHCVAEAIKATCETTLAYQLELGDTTITVKRVEDTNYVLHKRSDPQREAMFCLPYWGEACMDVRYWLLQSEINDKHVKITNITESATECMITASPPKWRDTIYDLVQNNLTTQGDET